MQHEILRPELQAQEVVAVDAMLCVAKQNLVLAIDGSGSLRASGFEILKGVSASFIERYKGKYYGYEDMKIGVVQFGSGEIFS